MVSMRMGLEMKMSQQLIMTPQLQQAIKLLQLSRIELEELIDQSLIENPTLETKPIEKEEDEPSDANSKTEEADNFVEEQSQLSYDEEWQNYIESGAGVIQDVRGKINDSEERGNILEATVSQTKSLKDHLFWQLETSKFSEIEYDIAEFIIGNIDNDAYLSVSLRDMLHSNPDLLQLVLMAKEQGIITPVIDSISATRFDTRHDLKHKEQKKKKGKVKTAPFLETDETIDNLSEEDILSIEDELCGIMEAVLQKIQSYDPPGVATRDLQECLENQLITLGLEDSLAFRVVRSNMGFLEQKDLKKIARLQKADIQEVVKAYQIITALEPKPGRPFAGDITQYVIPDVYIYKRSDEYIVHMNTDNIPRLRINPYYQKIVTENKDEKSQQKRLINIS